MKIKPIEGGKEIAQEAERHKVKRLTQQDILNAARKAGDSVVALATQQWDARLIEQLTQGGVAAAMPHCQPENYEEVEALQHKYGAISRRVSGRPRNPQNQLDAQVTTTLQRYTQSQSDSAEVVALNQEELLYTAPIYVRQENCLNCHGTPGKELAPADYTLIQEKYPKDQAINYKKGDLIGMWHITFDKADFVAFLNDQPKKSRRRR
ncbi:Tll0287-like domain-containing protein [Pontibacter roseus]|uniref:Tll0287-like domain-containing protein n=1 Tax=Pontibacter roseus TaxID=336989 RepID=UPI0003774815|nr:DUF3365 domain-containing protein [Pontibacter roseus]